jgi:hypothetical protein
MRTMPTSDDLIIRINDDDGKALEEHRFNPSKFLTAEAIAAERVTRLNWLQIMAGTLSGNMACIAAIVWLMRKRKDPKAKYDDVQFCVGDVEVFDPDVDERYQPEPPPEPMDVGDLNQAEPEGPKDES